jgi:dienelactone hydrolase
METRRIIRYRSLLSALAFIISMLVFPGGGALQAQTPPAASQGLRASGGGAGATRQGDLQQEAIPADHYDPDDTKIFADVLTEDREVTISGRQLTIHFYRPRGDVAAVPAIYACGDGGWRGLAPRTAEQLAHLGFAVAGIDSKVYLREFSSVANPLTISRLASDYAEIAKVLRQYAKVEAQTPVYVYGWSLGAGFAVAVGSDPGTRAEWAGIISIGLPAQNQLASGLGANHADLRNPANAHYGFRTETLIAALSPMPLVMIQSTTDTASPQKVGKAIFSAALDPKQYVLIKATNHRFSGARDEFYTALANAMTWIKQARSSADPAQVTARQNSRATP